jgi:two-component system nitrogen regulation sensor histidine kinase GlnL
MLSSRRVQKILDNLNTAVLTLDGVLRITSLNTAAEQLLGMSRRHARGRPLAQSVAGNGGLLDPIRKALDSGQTLIVYEVPLRLPDGRHATVDCTVTPIAEDNGRDRLVVECTEVDRLQRMARGTDLAQRQAANREMLRGLAHEIKNPLGGVRGAAQLLDRELPERQYREYTRIIIHEADRLRKLVDRMLSAEQLPRRATLNVHTVLEHVRLLVEAECGADLKVVRDYDPSLPNVLGDEEQLTQALLNVVRNSIQALDCRGRMRLVTRIARRVTLGERIQRQAVRIDIEDDGPGVPPALRERLFYPMVTGRPDGTGLGLAIAHEIATRHGGAIEFESEPGRTRFTFYLPIA